MYFNNLLINIVLTTLGDIAVESTKYAKRTHLVTSRGSYVISRFTKYGKAPIESSSLRPLIYLPKWIKNYVIGFAIPSFSNSVADIEKLGLKPKSPLSNIINDEILHKIAFGKIEVHQEIVKTNERSVYFNDGSVEHDVDMIVLCTGYTRNFPFLDEDILKPKRSGKYLPLYKEMFPIKRSESLAFVGMFSTSNSIAFTSEMQARYIAEVFLGNIRLPKPDVMEQCIQAKCKIFDDMFGGDLKELNYVSIQIKKKSRRFQQLLLIR